jgi:hypothetical protein
MPKEANFEEQSGEKSETIRIVGGSQRSVRRTLGELGVGCSTFYRWYQRYLEEFFDGLPSGRFALSLFWNRILDEVRERVVAIALEKIELSPQGSCRILPKMKSSFISRWSLPTRNAS